MAKAKNPTMPQRPPAKRRNFQGVPLASRMTVSAAPSQRLKKRPSQPDPGPDPGPWKYDRDLHAILHDSESCKVCLTWREHFINSSKNEDELLSITAARHALDSASDVQDEIHKAQRRRNEASEVLAKLHRKLGVVRGDLRNIMQGQDMGMYANKYLNSESY